MVNYMARVQSQSLLCIAKPGFSARTRIESLALLFHLGMLKLLPIRFAEQHATIAAPHALIHRACYADGLGLNLRPQCPALQ
jgi:hypothetical protein